MKFVTTVLTLGSLFLSANAFAASYILCTTGDRDDSFVTKAQRLFQAQNELNNSIQAFQKDHPAYTEVSAPGMTVQERDFPTICVTLSTAKVATVVPACGPTK